MKIILKNLPFWFLWLIVFSLPFVNLPDLRSVGLPIQFTDVLFLLAALIWLIFLLLRREKLRRSWFYLPLLIWFVSLCLSAGFSENLKTSLIKLPGSLYLLGLAILTFNLSNSETRLRKIGMAWLSATFLVCFVSLASLILFYFDRENHILLTTLSHYGSLPAGNYARIQSTFINPNMLCSYLNISLIFLLLAFRFNWLTKNVLLIFSLCFSITAIFTVSPGLGGIFLTIGVWFWLEKKNESPLLAKLALFSGISAAIFFFVTMLPSPTNFPQKLEPSPRILAWSSAIETFSKNPIVGRGLGLDAGSVVYESPNGTQFLGDAHQLFLNVAATQGIIGLAAILLLMFWLIRRSFPLEILGSNNYVINSALGLAFISAFCYQGLGGSLEDARHIWVLIGLLASASEFKAAN